MNTGFERITQRHLHRRSGQIATISPWHEVAQKRHEPCIYCYLVLKKWHQTYKHPPNRKTSSWAFTKSTEKLELAIKSNSVTRMADNIQRHLKLGMKQSPTKHPRTTPCNEGPGQTCAFQQSLLDNWQTFGFFKTRKSVNGLWIETQESSNSTHFQR